MSRGGIAGIVIACLVGGYLIGVYGLPDRSASARNETATGPSLARQDGRADAPPAPTLPPSVRPIVEGEARKVAKEVAAQVASTSPDRDIAIEPSPKPNRLESPVVVSRESLEMTLPAGSIVKPENPKYGSEKLIETRFPGGGSLNIVVTDDRDTAAEHTREALEGLKSAVKDPIDIPNPELTWLNLEHVNGFHADLAGKPFGFEVGCRQGRDKGFVIIAEYPYVGKGKPNRVTTMMRDALMTLKLKQ